MLLDLAPEVPPGTSVLAAMEREMSATLAKPPQGGPPPPFPPALIARGAACVLAEAYASSFPLTALQLVDPPISMQRATQRYPSLFPSALPEFTFEAQFPVRVTWTQPELAWHAEHGVPWYEVHRIEHQREDAAGECLDRYEWASFDDGLDDTIRWLEDEAGL